MTTTTIKWNQTMNRSLLTESSEFSYQLNCLEYSLWIFDSNLLDEIQQRTENERKMSSLVRIAKETLKNVTEGYVQLIFVSEVELAEELVYVIDEFTNDPVKVLIVLLILVENIAYVETVPLPMELEKYFLGALKFILETNYDFQIEIPNESLAA